MGTRISMIGTQSPHILSSRALVVRDGREDDKRLRNTKRWRRGPAQLNVRRFLSAQRKEHADNRPEDSNDPYANLRRVSDQLAQLLDAPTQQDLKKLNDLLSDKRLKDHLEHHPEAVEAKNRIDAERDPNNARPSRHRIGEKLMQIARTLDDCTSCGDDAASLTNGALKLTETIALAFLG